jgi:hypothetical protein
MAYQFADGMARDTCMCTLARLCRAPSQGFVGLQKAWEIGILRELDGAELS